MDLIQQCQKCLAVYPFHNDFYVSIIVLFDLVDGDDRRMFKLSGDLRFLQEHALMRVRRANDLFNCHLSIWVLLLTTLTIPIPPLPKTTSVSDGLSGNGF